MKQLGRATLLVCSLLMGVLGFGQSAVTPTSARDGNFGETGVAVKVSLLGVGAEAAVQVTPRTNIRAGFNMISYSRGFNKDGIAYAGQLDFKTFEAHYDIFPWAKSFHISPGLLVYAADPITATASVPGGQSFSLGGTNYYSDPADPIKGNGKITFNRASPMVTFGFGNLVPRGEHKHFSIPVEFGVAFQGSPKASLGLTGTACDSTLTICHNAGTDPTIQSNIVSEQNKVNNSMSFFKVYPIISVGFGYKF